MGERDPRLLRQGKSFSDLMPGQQLPGSHDPSVCCSMDSPAKVGAARQLLPGAVLI